MTIGGSLVLIAIGAILKFAVTARVSGIDVGTVGVVLMVVGLVGLVISIIWLLSQRRRLAAPLVEQRRYVEPVAPERVDPTYRTPPADPGYRTPPGERPDPRDPYDPRV